MAEIQQKTLARQETPVYKQTTATQEYRTPDEFIGDKHFAEAEVWKAGVGFTKFMAGVVGVIEADRQEAVGDDIIRRIMEENLLNTGLIDNELPKIDSTLLNPTEMMENFGSDGLKTDAGMIKMQPLEEYKGFEFLGKKEKRRVLADYEKSEMLTKQNIMKQVSKLSRDHKIIRLKKDGAETKNFITTKLQDGRNWNKKSGMAAYLSKMSNGYGHPTQKGYREYWVDQLMEGNTKIPGAPEGGAKIEDLGVSGGLKPEIKRQIDAALERHSNKLFDALGSNTIELSDVHDELNDVMQFTLMDQFLGEYTSFPEQAIKRAKAGGYQYKREYLGQGGEGELDEINYVLDPALLKPHIERHALKSVKKSKPLYVAKIMRQLQLEQRLVYTKLNAQDLLENRWADDDMLTDADRGKFYNLVFDYNLKKLDADQVTDKAQIVNSWTNEFMRNPGWLDYISVLQPDGTRKSKNMNEVRKYIPDSTVTNERWAYDESEDVMKGRLVSETIETLGSKRQGALILTKEDVQNFILTHIKDTQEARKAGFVALAKQNIATEEGRFANFQDFAVFIDGKPTNQVNSDQVAKFYLREGEYSTNIQKAFPTIALFNTFVTDVVTETYERQQREDKKNIPKEILRKYIPETDENMDAFMKALAAEHKQDVKTWQNIALGNEDLEGRATNPENEGSVVPKTNPVGQLLLQMRTKLDDPSLEWGKKAREYLKHYRNSQNALLRIATQFRTWDMKQLEGTVAKLNSTGDGNTYFLNLNLATHVKQRLVNRMAFLNNPDTVAKLIDHEWTTTNMWQTTLELDENTSDIDRNRAIAEHLGFSNQDYINESDSVTGESDLQLRLKRMFRVKSGTTTVQDEEILKQGDATLTRALIQMPDISFFNIRTSR